MLTEKCLPVKNAHPLKAKLVWKKYVFTDLLKTCQDNLCISLLLSSPLSLRQKLFHRICGSGTQNTLIQEEQPAVRQPTVSRPPSQSAPSHCTASPLKQNWVTCANQERDVSTILQKLCLFTIKSIFFKALISYPTLSFNEEKTFSLRSNSQMFYLLCVQYNFTKSA